MQCLLIISLFCLAFFQGFISERVLGVSYLTTGEPDSMLSRLLVEVFVAANVAWLWLRQPVRFPPGSFWFGLYGAWSILAGLLVEHSFSNGFMYCRYTLYAYAVYFVAWNCSFAPDELRRVTRVLLGCFAIQLAASVLHVFVLHDRVEWRVGTMMISGGELAALFPLVALGYAVACYLYIKQSWWMLAAGLSFGLIGYSSGKRAVYFLIPLALTLILGLYYLQQRRGPALDVSRLVLHVTVAGLALFPGFIYGIGHSHGINAGARGSIGQLGRGAVSFALDYENGVDEDGLATGRISASTRVAHSLLQNGPRAAAFGWGPATMSRRGVPGQPTAAATIAGIAYGMVGWSEDTMSIGLPGAFAYLAGYCCVFLATWRSLSQPLHRSWRAIAFGTLSGLAVLILAYLFYGSVFMFSGVVPFVIFFYAGVLTRPQGRVCA